MLKLIGAELTGRREYLKKMWFGGNSVLKDKKRTAAMDVEPAAGKKLCGLMSGKMRRMGEKEQRISGKEQRIKKEPRGISFYHPELNNNDLRKIIIRETFKQERRK